MSAPAGPARRWPSRRVYVALTIATLLGYTPVVSVLIATGVAAVAGCRLDEGDVHPCVVAGADLGSALYSLFVMGWLMLVTWPVMLLAPVMWLALLVRAVFLRTRRRRSRPP